eukprot:GSChrysophyteH2.ASY1.ANO1.268.1 assembled CDS
MSTLDGVINFVTGAQPRGLHNFISEIRNIDDKGEEVIRVDKELGNIRQKFTNSQNLTSYQRKKYVWKLCYIYMLGYEVDFGHVEFISLLGASNFTEKSVGYLAAGLLLRPDDQLLSHVITSIKNDLNSSVFHARTLALSAVSNIGGDDLATSLAPDVRPPTSQEVTRNNNAVFKKACLATLRLYRAKPEIIAVDQWMPALITLTEHNDLGVVTSAMALINGLASHNQQDYELLVPYVVAILTRLVIDSRYGGDYSYYRVPCPWLQIKCLRFLQYFQEPHGQAWSILSSVLTRILSGTCVCVCGEADHSSVNVQNTHYSLVFEAIALVCSWGPTDRDGDHYELREMSHSLLGRYIAVNDANIKYLALDMLARVAKVDGVDATMQTYANTAVASLGDADMSVRKRALEVIFLITDKQNASSMVADLVQALATAEEYLREDMVVKIAILAERFYENIRWYVDTMIEVIVVAGSHVAEAVWYRIVQTVINNEEVHEYAAQKLFNSVQSKTCHEVCICLAAYLLGEIGFFICDKPGCSGFEQFAALHQHFELITAPSKSLLLTCYIKLSNQYPDVTDEVQAIFKKLSSSSELDLQQRACEYAALPLQGEDIMQAILERMPNWAEKEVSVLQHITEATEASKETADKQASQTDEDDDAFAPSGTAAPKTSSNNSPAVRPVSVDLLSMNDPSANDSMGGGSAAGLTDAEKATIAKLFGRAVVAGPVKSILYENDLMSIDCISDFRGAQGRQTVTVYNKGNNDLTNVKFDVQNAFEGDYIAVRVNPPAGTTICSMDELKLQVALAARRPFSGSPEQAPTCTCIHTCLSPCQHYQYLPRLWYAVGCMGNSRFLSAAGSVGSRGYCGPHKAHARKRRDIMIGGK